MIKHGFVGSIMEIMKFTKTKKARVSTNVNSMFICFLVSNSLSIKIIKIGSSDTVSYTHLDVYKRQV